MTETGPASYQCPQQPGVLHLLESEYIAEIIDANGDGRVSTTEAQSHAQLNEGFRTADANGDGYVSQTEFDAWAPTATPAEPAAPATPATPSDPATTPQSTTP